MARRLAHVDIIATGVVVSVVVFIVGGNGVAVLVVAGNCAGFFVEPALTIDLVLPQLLLKVLQPVCEQMHHDQHSQMCMVVDRNQCCVLHATVLIRCEQQGLRVFGNPRRYEFVLVKGR